MSILQNEETMTTFLSDSNKDFDRYKTDRDSIGFDDKMLVNDGMYRCFKNTALKDAEAASTSKAPDTRASIGSVRFFRMVNQKASLGYAISSSVDLPFKYGATTNAEVWGSAEEASSQAAIHNVLAKYAWKNGNCKQKMYEFWFQAHKYCNVPVQIVMNKDVHRVALKDPKTKKIAFKEKEINVFPTFNILHWSMLYADLYAKNIQDQNCVVVLSIVPWMEIQKGLKSKWYDKEQILKIRQNLQKYRWDGTEGSTIRQDMVENSGSSGYSAGESELYLKWDVYRWVPINGEVYDDEADYELYWCTTIGNSLTNSIPIRMEKDFDPDGEIPIRMIKVIPDDTDMLYSMSWGEAARSMYSVECTLWAQTIDNIAGVNTPPIVYDSTMFKNMPTDFKYSSGQKWDVDDINQAIKEFAPRDTTSQTSQLINIIQNEEGVSGSINSNMMGESNGGRTPASESMAINRFSQQPNLGETSYVLHQLIGFIAKKYKSYAQAYLDPKMIKMIADEELDYPVYAEEAGYQIYGDFDVEINVVDEFVEDFVQAGQELQLLQMVSANPALLEGKKHRVDVGAWLESALRRLKVHGSDHIIIPTGGVDARLRQRDEIRSMIETGQYIDPQEGEDHEAHIAELNAEIMRWMPVLNAKIDPAAGQMKSEQGKVQDIITLLLQPHMDAHKQFIESQGAAQQQQAQQAQQTTGQMAGNEIAGELGSIQPQ